MTLLGQSATLIDQLQPAAPAQPEPGSPADAAPPSASPPAGTTLEQAIADYRQEVSDILAGRALPSTHGLLIDGGIIELPPVGYLPIDPNPQSQTTLEAQVYQLLGHGVDLRFCVMQHDDAGAQFTRAQHLDRISLLAGLEQGAPLQQVDILVPDGTWPTSTTPAPAAEPGIKPTLDWVLFRRRSDVNCSPPPQQVDTVTLYADTASSGDAAQKNWGELSAHKSSLPWTRVGDLQFDSGTTTLVTPGTTVQGWWTAAGIGTHLYGAAYAPATTSDLVALGRVYSLVRALRPTVIGEVELPVTLPTPQPNTGTVGTLFVVAWSASQ
jgi:hypothetical protein